MQHDTFDVKSSEALVLLTALYKLSTLRRPKLFPKSPKSKHLNKLLLLWFSY